MNKTDPKPFLSRWAKRKAARQPEADEAGDAEDAGLLDQTEANSAPDTGADTPDETEEEAALSDEELCARYELPDPRDCSDPDQLDGFFDGADIPDRLRQLAMRRLWRLNPLFRFADEMVDYGEDFTDAATVIPNMQTAYKVGKGYLDKLMAEQKQADAELVPVADGAAELPKKQAENSAAKGSATDDTAELPKKQAEKQPENRTESETEPAPENSDVDEAGPVLAATDTDIPVAEAPEQVIRPRHMIFHKNQT